MTVEVFSECFYLHVCNFSIIGFEFSNEKNENAANMSSAFEAPTSSSRWYSFSIVGESDSEFIYWRVFERPGLVIIGSRNGSDPFGSYSSQNARGIGRTIDERIFEESLGLEETKGIDFYVAILSNVDQKQQKLVQN